MRTSLGKPSARFQKLPSTLVSWSFLLKRLFFRENLRLLTDFERKCLVFGKNFLTCCSQLLSLCPEEIFEEFFPFPQSTQVFLIVFGLWGELFGVFAKVIWLGCQNCFQKSRGGFRKNCFTENKFFELFLYFWTLGTKILDLRRTLFNRFVKIAFYVSRGGFWLDCFLYENSWVFHRLWAVKRIFWNICARALKCLSKLHFTCTKEILGSI